MIMTNNFDPQLQKIIDIATLLAQKNGYGTDAWRLFEREAEAALVRMSFPASQFGSPSAVARQP
jgi:hypothetical protein